MWKLLTFALVMGLVMASQACKEQAVPELTLATTTSTYDSGLLESLLPPFEKANSVKVKVIAVGSGQAMDLGKRGDADVLLVHDPQKEEEFMAQGYGASRQRVMQNDFVVVGPAQDVAGIRGMKNAPAAFARIAAAQAAFISRGDESGTHSKEKSLWDKASVNAASKGAWYRSAGQGMGATLSMADELQAYTLADRSTYLALRARLKLAVLVEGDEELWNPYSVIALNAAKFPNLQHELASKFIQYLMSSQGEDIIDNFGKDKFGESIFFSTKQASKGVKGP